MRGPGNQALFVDGARVPANVGGLPVYLPDHDHLAGAGLAPALLFDAAGQAVPVSVEEPTRPHSPERRLIATAPLAPGPYRVKVTAMSETKANTLVDTMTTIEVTPAAPLPSSAPTIVASAPSRRAAVIPGGSMCRETVDSAVIDVKVSVGEEYRPFRSLTVFEASRSDALRWATREGPPVTLADGLDESLSQTFSITVPCKGGGASGTVTFGVRVRGIDSEPVEAKADLTFPTCDSLPEEGSGCSTAPGSARPSAGLILAVTVVLARLRSARRRPRPIAQT